MPARARRSWGQFPAGFSVARVAGAEKGGIEAGAPAAVESETLAPKDLREPIFGRGLDERDLDRLEAAARGVPARLLRAGEADDEGSLSGRHVRTVQKFLQPESASAHVRGLLQLQRGL